MHTKLKSFAYFDLSLDLDASLPSCPQQLSEGTCENRGVWWRTWSWRDCCCHLDGLVLSLLSPAIRLAAPETETRLLRNADARLTFISCCITAKQGSPRRASVHNAMDPFRWRDRSSQSWQFIWSNPPSLCGRSEADISSVFKVHILYMHTFFFLHFLYMRKCTTHTHKH